MVLPLDLSMLSPERCQRRRCIDACLSTRCSTPGSVLILTSCSCLTLGPVTASERNHEQGLVSICSPQSCNKLMVERELEEGVRVTCLCFKLGLSKEGKVEVSKLVGQSSESSSSVMAYDPPSESTADVTWFLVQIRLGAKWCTGRSGVQDCRWCLLSWRWA